jgi:hypothetical protein
LKTKRAKNPPAHAKCEGGKATIILIKNAKEKGALPTLNAG